MKRISIYALTVLAAAILTAACTHDLPDTSKSVISQGEIATNDFDKWLEVNYVEPYNINFQYRYNINESDLDYITIPARYDYSIKLAHLVKHLCIDSYDEVAGIEFTRKYFPKMFFLIGAFEYNSNGTMVLGTAEGGRKIILAGVNSLGTYLSSAANLNRYYIKTIHHEFTHILNQTAPYSPDFRQISGENYVANAWSDSNDASARSRGFITAYASSEDVEDFAEMMSEYVTNSPATWNSYLTQAGAAASIIEQKLEIVKDYMQTSFGIDLDELRSIISRRQDEVMSGQVDLDDLTI